MRALLEPGAPCAVVFSHPNHELAIFGLLQNVRPHLVFLTDGGGPERESETRLGLDRLGLRGQAVFLGYAEADLYAGLLARDAGFFEEIACDVRKALDPVSPTYVLCDAIEFYNPIHDLSLPIVRHALGDVPLYEIPLVYERAETVDDYVLQRFPPGHPQRPSRLALTPTEYGAKLTARDEVYSLLRAQLGHLLHDSDERFAREEIAPAPAGLPAPGRGRSLRYERRGELLRQRGEVDRVITHDAHYRPVAEALLAT